MEDVYSGRIPEIRHIAGGELIASEKRHTRNGVLEAMALAVEKTGTEPGFSPNLGWSHYRALMNVENLKFVWRVYEQEIYRHRS